MAAPPRASASSRETRSSRRRCRNDRRDGPPRRLEGTGLANHGAAADPRRRARLLRRARPGRAAQSPGALVASQLGALRLPVRASARQPVFRAPHLDGHRRRPPVRPLVGHGAHLARQHDRGGGGLRRRPLSPCRIQERPVLAAGAWVAAASRARRLAQRDVHPAGADHAAHARELRARRHAHRLERLSARQPARPGADHAGCGQRRRHGRRGAHRHGKLAAADAHRARRAGAVGAAALAHAAARRRLNKTAGRDAMAKAGWEAALAALLALIVAPAARADAAWDALVKSAIAEGEVDVHGGPGAVFEKVLTERFKSAYPAIKINFSGTSGRDVIEQILRERQAGIYKWDVYVGGTPSILQTLKPAGAFQPLRPTLRLPEVLADSAWFGGFDFGWVDKEKTYTFAFDFTLNPVIWVNWDFVKPADLKSFADLDKPQFAGKIVFDDPRFPGAGQLVGQTMLVNFGEPALIKLFAGQKIVYTTNRRQNAEWVVRGRYPIGLATGTEDLAIFKEQGIGKNVKGLVPDGLKILGSIGFGTVSAMANPPHPNAARLYINWLLSKDGQAD